MPHIRNLRWRNERAIVIIGSGFAAYQLIKTIRRSDVDTAITVITADDGHDYNKPDLSHVFSKNQSVEDVITAKAEEFAQSQNLTLLASHVVSKVDTSAKQVVANDKAIAYSKLVLATGASAFVPPIEGANKEELLTLNSLKEFEQNRTKLADANRVMVIGGGVIGVEVALDLATAGKRVTLVEPNTQLMRAQLPEYIAFKLVQSLQDKDVRVITGKGVASVSHKGSATSVGSVMAVGLKWIRYWSLLDFALTFNWLSTRELRLIAVSALMPPCKPPPLMSTRLEIALSLREWFVPICNQQSSALFLLLRHYLAHRHR